MLKTQKSTSLSKKKSTSVKVTIASPVLCVHRSAYLQLDGRAQSKLQWQTTQAATQQATDTAWGERGWGGREWNSGTICHIIAGKCPHVIISCFGRWKELGQTENFNPRGVKTQVQEAKLTSRGRRGGRGRKIKCSVACFISHSRSYSPFILCGYGAEITCWELSERHHEIQHDRPNVQPTHVPRR